jgi:PAS domain S-box-containing protein
MERLWGYKPEEMIGKSPFDAMPPDVRERAMEDFKRSMSSPYKISGIVTTAYDAHGNLI